MSHRGALVGRQAELAELGAALQRSRLGTGSLVLVAGEAGVGKTRLAGALAEGADAEVLHGHAARTATAPYGPVVAALRSYLRRHPDGLAGYGPLRPHLALLLPELGKPAAGGDAATMSEAVRGAFVHLAAAQPLLVLLDDLQWSDEATLELLPALADAPLLTVATYRSDGLPRDHALRRLRHELRRSGRLHELALAPLGLADTTAMLAEILDTAPPPAHARAIHERARGVPFFVEELARGVELAASGEVPETIRDAVLLRAAELTADGRAAAAAAAVAGEAFELEAVAALASADGVHELIENGVVHEDGLGRGAFRHALTRDALYADVPWLQRRILHRRLAEALEAGGGSAMEVATHWLRAHNEPRAREALVRAARESRAVHAHRDAARVAKQALELWPAGDEEERRLALLEDFAASAELSGDLAGAAAAWREICAGRIGEPLGAAQRRLAALHDLRGDREAAATARRAAADAFAAAGSRGEAAVERLVLADYLRLAARHSAATELAQAAARDAEVAERLDLRARALGIEGVTRAIRGDVEGGLSAVETGLALALDNGLTAVSAELYQRLSVLVYDTADYRRAQETLGTALALCGAGDAAATEMLCIVCMVYVLRETGEWPRALELGAELIPDSGAAYAAEGLVGLIHAFQGKLKLAHRELSSSLAGSLTAGDYNMAADSLAGLAWVAAAQDNHDEAAELCRAMLERWKGTEDNHVSIRGLRWAAAYQAQRGDLPVAHACAEALGRIAAATGHPDALAALAHAIGETALATGDEATAAEQLSRAVDLHRTLEIPYERAEISMRAGVALAAVGERELALERLGAAYRTARKLRARPLAAEAARAVAALGESVDQRLGRRAAADAAGAGLSRRELEVVRLVGTGRTNRQIAQELFLSKRTVDMHVHNVLRKLDCRSRLEAARRAEELGLLI